jgi:hypothetical protein
MCFHPSSSGRRRAERGTADSVQPVAEDGGATWQRPVEPAPVLGPTSDAPSPARRSVSAVEREEGGRRCSDALEMEDGGGHEGGGECGTREWRGEE